MRKVSKISKMDRDNKTVTFTIKKGTYRSGKQNWRVTATISQKPIDRRFSQRWEAERFIEDFGREEKAASLKQNVVTTHLSQVQINDASVAVDRLPKGVSLVEAVDFYIKHQPKSTKTVNEAIEALIVEKKRINRRKRTIREYQSVLKGFKKLNGWCQVSSITRQVVESCVYKGKASPQTQNNRLRVFSSFFNFCIENQWVAVNPLERTKKVQVDPQEITFFDVSQARKVLEAAKTQKYSSLIPYITVCMFCGLRSGEAELLTWSNIVEDGDELHIRVQASMAKKRGPRTITTPTNAGKLLKSTKTDRFIPKNFQRILNEFKKSFDFQWGYNIMRHSFGTYHYALQSNESLTAAMMGNSPEILHSHYRGLVSAKDAKAYFEIT